MGISKESHGNLYKVHPSGLRHGSPGHPHRGFHCDVWVLEGLNQFLGRKNSQTLNLIEIKEKHVWKNDIARTLKEALFGLG